MSPPTSQPGSNDSQKPENERYPNQSLAPIRSPASSAKMQRNNCIFRATSAKFFPRAARVAANCRDAGGCISDYAGLASGGSAWRAAHAALFMSIKLYMHISCADQPKQRMQPFVRSATVSVTPAVTVPASALATPPAPVCGSRRVAASAKAFAAQQHQARLQ